MMARTLGQGLPALESASHLPAFLESPLLARARTIHARRGQIIFSEGTPSTDVYYVVSGAVQVSIFSVHGRETILRDVGTGCLVGDLAALDDHPRSASVVATEDSVFAFLSGAAFRDFIAEVPHAGLWVSQQLAVLVRDLTKRTFELATMPVSNRVQNELLRLAREAGVVGDQSVILRFPTHAGFAARVGTHREAVTRELRLLASEGIARQSGRSMTVLSVERLRALTGRTAR